MNILKRFLPCLLTLVGSAAFIVLSFLLGGCAAPPEAANRETAAASAGFASRSAPPVPERRPGLGTEYGEERRSPIDYAGFHRANGNHPLATATIFYDDASGVRAQAGERDDSFAEPPDQARGLISLTVLGENGLPLRSFVSGGRRYVVGRAGQRYSLRVRNRTDARLEVVLSVDGLDVIDGRSASYAKPGYLIAAHDTLRVEGFRSSRDTVAAFRFGPVSESYASRKHGDTRNVGVIGAAVFGERGRLPFGGGDEETERRRRANPFPNQFASPPPPRY